MSHAERARIRKCLDLVAQYRVDRVYVALVARCLEDIDKKSAVIIAEAGGWNDKEKNL